jgi:DNA-binding protein HU-beta|uniref:HU family DNA-binding protein n=1 Tax=candidate division WOR-3 bacterium TaxID=2052148 RepID=A0A7V5XYP1_UNCW3
MKKAELINKIAQDVGLTKKQATACLDAFIDAIKQVVKKNDKLAIPGLGIFGVRKTKARKGRNPKTGEIIDIPAKKKVYFRAAKPLKELLK